ncbi:hypothetical protein KK141_07695 [Dyella sp. LX-66]|uniref:hypothetical protein n=1 Tax=unclassified Dyella TaxID=2634549 RepID=UPI001BE128F0|nr:MULTISPECIES: hypothetical protein [unclassified Dyella]MBT2115597.1 hypothetical protein [Dyella sp. LX-1]MBT2139412.1 hypothetical protein [Dyella sp. LX-66]
MVTAAATKPDEDIGTMYLMVIYMGLVMPLGLIAVLMSQDGVSLFAGATRYVAIPAGGIAGFLVALHLWKSFKAKDFMYVDKDGDTVQREPLAAALLTVFLACFLGGVVAFGVRAVLRCAVKVMPGRPVAFQTHVTSLWSARGCHINVEYADLATAGSVTVCTEWAPGKRWIGEPVTVRESVGLLGAKLDRLKYDDADDTSRLPPAAQSR